MNNKQEHEQPYTAELGDNWAKDIADTRWYKNKRVKVEILIYKTQ